MKPRASASVAVTLRAIPAAPFGATDDTSTDTTQPAPTFPLGRVSSRRTGFTPLKPPIGPPAPAVTDGGAGHPAGVCAPASIGAMASGTVTSTATTGAANRARRTRIPPIHGRI